MKIIKNTMPDPVTPNNPASSMQNKIPFPILRSSQNIEYWFVQVEAWFKLQNVTDDDTQFQAIVTSLTPELFDQSITIVQNPPASEKFKAIKDNIIAKFGDSENSRVNKLLAGIILGDKKPSHMLAEMQRVGATTDENFLRVCWLRRLPEQIRAIVSASASNIQEQAKIADAALEALQMANVHQISGEQKSDQSNVLAKQIDALTKQIEELKFNRSRSTHRRDDRSQSRGDENRKQKRDRTRTPSSTTCWYHRNFGTSAKKCIDPCNFYKQPQSTDQT